MHFLQPHPLGVCTSAFGGGPGSTSSNEIEGDKRGGLLCAVRCAEAGRLLSVPQSAISYDGSGNFRPGVMSYVGSRKLLPSLRGCIAMRVAGERRAHKQRRPKHQKSAGHSVNRASRQQRRAIVGRGVEGQLSAFAVTYCACGWAESGQIKRVRELKIKSSA